LSFSIFCFPFSILDLREVAVPETILIVDDEESIRRTFREWLESAGLGEELLVAGDAETALKVANERTVDLAILDWNLGAGNNGLQLLEDLSLFNPDVVAVMITGYANQATPLDAMRMGVRDYLDKNQELRRETFLRVIARQLEKIRPAKRERQLYRGLMEFRGTVEKILPLVRTAAALNDPVPFTESIRHLFRFLLRTTGARDGVLLVRSYDPAKQPPETFAAFNIQGDPLTIPLVPFAQSLAGAVVGMDPPCVAADLERAPEPMGVRLQPFEQASRYLLAAALPVGPGLSVVLELFDKTPHPPSPLAGEGSRERRITAFTDDDRRIVSAAAEFGAEMIKQALAERQTQGMLVDAVAAAMKASQNVTGTIAPPSAHAKTAPDQPPPGPVLDQLRQSLEQFALGMVDPDQALRLAELLRVIALRHGRQAVQYCIQLLEGVDKLLRAATGDHP
jgi:two-component system, NtrC family, nitrogen regulation response regulator NtrX